MSTDICCFYEGGQHHGDRAIFTSYNNPKGNADYIFNKITEGKLTNAYVEIRILRGSKKAKDVLLILNNRPHERLGVMTAKELTIEGSELLGKDISLISSVRGEENNNFSVLHEG